MENKTKVDEVVTLVFKAVALAMAVAVIVLGALGTATVATQVTLLGIGLFGLAINSLSQGERDEHPSR